MDPAAAMMKLAGRSSYETHGRGWIRRRHTWAQVDPTAAELVRGLRLQRCSWVGVSGSGDDARGRGCIRRQQELGTGGSDGGGARERTSAATVLVGGREWIRRRRSRARVYPAAAGILATISRRFFSKSIQVYSSLLPWRQATELERDGLAVP
ncbi:Os08g0334500 [Oryza sativa Japonica Group]|uniref:Os08g0334500 protein n=1 Tax=Oryza sativa subsp. japonica TaxID=39947 RepID=A0A0P0XEZ0_ORYSJ|nr:Os08g0334500 [Oryza sativa Japonica Group]